MYYYHTPAAMGMPDSLLFLPYPLNRKWERIPNDCLEFVLGLPVGRLFILKRANQANIRTEWA